MRMKKISRMLSLGLCCAMILSSSACGKQEKEDTQNKNQDVSNENENADNETSDEVVTLTYYSQLANTDLSDKPWIQEMFEKELGLRLEVKLHSTDADPSAIMLASGELSDIWLDCKEDTDVVQEVLESADDFLLNLEDYKEYLPNIFENPILEPMLNYMKTTYGGVYALKYGVGSEDRIHICPQIRYDVYKELGYPEIKDEWELLDILEQMVALEPETEEGYKTYGLGYMGDWGQGFANAGFGFSIYRGYYSETGIFEMPYDTSSSNEIRSLFDKESCLYSSLNWLFEANQRGLVDQDSKTGSWNDWWNKVCNGQYMYMREGEAYGLVGGDSRGYEFVEFTDEDITYPLMFDATIGDDRHIGLGAQLKNDEKKLEKALAFLNWLYDMDVIRLITSGEEGKAWEVNEKGQVQYTDAAMAYMEDDTLEHPKSVDGYTDAKWSDLASFFVEYPYKLATKMDDGYAIQITSDLNYYNRVYESSELRQDYASRHDGYNTFYTYHVAEGDLNFVKIPEETYSIPVANDEIVLIENTISALVEEAVPQMVFASDRAEFDAIYDDLCKDAEAAGLAELTEDYQTRWIEAIDTINSYK